MMPKKTLLTICFLLIATLSGSTSRADTQTADAEFDRAMALFFKGNSWTSTDILEKNVAENPGHAISYSGLAFIHAQGLIDPLYNGTAEDALECIKKARENGPDNKWNHLALAIIATSKYIHGDLAAFPQLEKEVKVANRIDPSAGEPYLFLWLINKFLKGNPTEAKKYYDLTVSKGVKYMNAHYLFHYSYSFFGSCDDAVQESEMAYSVDPYAWEAYIAWDKPDGGDIRKMALADCHFWKALKSDYMGGGDEEKEKHLRAAVENSPGFMAAADLLASLLDTSGRAGEAEVLLQKNATITPRNTGAIMALAAYYSKSNNIEKLKQALMLLPSDEVFKPGPYALVYYRRLADLYKAAGDFAAEKKMLDKGESVKDKSLY